MSVLVIFDMKNRKMIMSKNGQKDKSFSIGKLFIELLEIDFSFYEKVYKNKDLTELYEYFDTTIASEIPSQFRDEKELNVLIDAHNRFFLGEEHPYFEQADIFTTIIGKLPAISSKTESCNLNEKTTEIYDISSIFDAFWEKMRLLQENMKRALEVCLDIEYRESSYENIPLLRYWEGQSKGLFCLPREYFHAEVEFFPREFSAESFLKNSRSHSTGNKKIKKQELLKMADMDTMGIVATNPLSLAFAEFSKMIDLKLWVRKCDNCGYYFLLGDNKNRRYCDKQRRGFSAPCNEIGPYHKELAKRNDPVHRARKAAENRLNGMITRSKALDFDKGPLRIEINRIVNDAKTGKVSTAEAINSLDKIGRVKRKSKSKKISRN